MAVFLRAGRTLRVSLASARKFGRSFFETSHRSNEGGPTVEFFDGFELWP